MSIDDTLVVRTLGLKWKEVWLPVECMLSPSSGGSEFGHIGRGEFQFLSLRWTRSGSCSSSKLAWADPVGDNDRLDGTEL